VENSFASPALRNMLARSLAPWGHARTAPALLGASIPSGSIIWAHIENFARHAAAYSELPPTVSRAIVDPAIGGPFAILMIAGALCLAVGVAQIIRALAACLRISDRAPRSSWRLLYVAAACEAAAIAGMIVLSQFTGEHHALVHDAGSYMLFFGHAIAITCLGALIARMLGDASLAGHAAMGKLTGHPLHARIVTALSIAFGIVYFAGKLAPEMAPFALHLMFSVLEMVVLLAFLAFLGRFTGFLSQSAKTRV
jgi:hypothetical protein